MTKLVGIKAVDKKPVEEVVSKLEELLEMAKSGELRELAYVGITRRNKALWDFVGEVDDINNMYTNLTHLTNRYYVDAFAGEDDEK